MRSQSWSAMICLYMNPFRTVAEHFLVSDEGVEFSVEGAKDAQITVQLEDDTDYRCM